MQIIPNTLSKKFMLLESQIFIALFLCLFTGFLALRLGSALQA